MKLIRKPKISLNRKPNINKDYYKPIKGLVGAALGLVAISAASKYIK